MEYEFEVINYGRPYFHESTLSTLTGLEFNEVHTLVKSIGKKRWGGQLYIKALQNLGFNTNPRFVKFNQTHLIHASLDVVIVKRVFGSFFIIAMGWFMIFVVIHFY